MTDLPPGYKLYIEHKRAVEWPPLPAASGPGVEVLMTSRQSQTGGRTVATIKNSFGHVMARGVAWCRSDETYNRKLGARIARGRAFKMLDEWLRIAGPQLLMPASPAFSQSEVESLQAKAQRAAANRTVPVNELWPDG